MTDRTICATCGSQYDRQGRCECSANPDTGTAMTRPELLRLMRLLAALESWGFSTGSRLPEYLHDELGAMVEVLEREILSDAAIRGTM